MIRNITIKNFGLIKEAKFDVSKYNVFSARNGKGKTTIINALYWLFTDKKMSDIFASENDIKNIIPNDDENAEVFVQIQIDNGTTFSKKYYNKFTKERGTNNIKFEGRRTEYYMNEGKINSEEYLKFLQSFFDFDMNELKVSDKTFNYISMLLDPFYLFSKVDSKTQRQVIGKITGEVTNEMIYKQNESFELLKDIDSQYAGDFDKARTQINSKIREQKDQKMIKDNQIKVLESTEFDENEYNELNKQYLDLVASLSNVSSQYNKEIKEKQDELFGLRQALIESENQDRLNNVNQKLVELNKTYQTKTHELYELQNKFNEDITNLKGIKNNISLNQNQIKSENVLLQQYKTSLVSLANWQAEIIECPNCGCCLTSDEEIERQKQIHNSQINVMKNNIENSETKIAKYEKELKDIGLKIKPITDDLDSLTIKIDNLKKELEDLKKDIALESNNNTSTNCSSENTLKLREEIEQLNKRLIELQNKEEQEKTLKQEEIKQQINTIKPKLDDLISTKSNLKKLNEIKEELEKLIVEINNNERLSTLCDLFIKTKIKMTNDIATQKLGIPFVMLEKQVNGAFKEVCYPTTPQGIPYNDSNTAFKILCGLKLRETINPNCKLPMFIDRGESLDFISKQSVKKSNIQFFIANVSDDENIILKRED